MTVTTKKTSDIYLAAAMLSLGAELVKTDKDDPRHMVFEFRAVPANDSQPSNPLVAERPVVDLEWVENQWVNGQLLVNGPRMADAIRKMKSVVHTSR